MNIAKVVFGAIDLAFDKRQNESVLFPGMERVRIERNIVYDYAEPKTCLLDCYYVPQQDKYPVIFNIHGGGFTAGGKEYRRTLCTWYALEGYYVVNVDYGLCPECHFPTPLLHLASALDWVADNADRLGLDLDRMVVSGDSAGAYYAAMLSTICISDKLKEVFKVSPKISFGAAILNCGLYDIVHLLRRRLLLHLKKRVFTLYTGIKEKDFDKYEYKDFFSPLPYINGDFPATFLVYAQKDIFCGGQAEYIIRALEANDIYYESYHTVSLKRNHCYSLEWTSGEALETNMLIHRFLNKFRNGELPRRASETNDLIRECEKTQS